MIKKFILISLAVLAIYYGGQYYVVFRLANLMPQCVDMKVLSEMDKVEVPKEDKIKFAREGWSCVKGRLNIFDRLVFGAFFKIPETWLVQPVR